MGILGPRRESAQLGFWPPTCRPACPIARNPATFSISISLRQTARATQTAVKNQKRKHKHEKRKQSQNGNKNSKRQKANSNNDDNNESEILHKDRCGGGGGNSTLDQPSARPLAMLMLLSPSRAEPSPESGNNCSNAAKTLTN